MQSKLVSPASRRRIWVLVLSSGEEVKETILKFASSGKLKAASLVALGACGARLFQLRGEAISTHSRGRASGGSHYGGRYRGK